MIRLLHLCLVFIAAFGCLALVSDSPVRAAQNQIGDVTGGAGGGLGGGINPRIPGTTIITPNQNIAVFDPTIIDTLGNAGIRVSGITSCENAEAVTDQVNDLFTDLDPDLQVLFLDTLFTADADSCALADLLPVFDELNTLFQNLENLICTGANILAEGVEYARNALLAELTPDNLLDVMNNVDSIIDDLDIPNAPTSGGASTPTSGAASAPTSGAASAPTTTPGSAPNAANPLSGYTPPPANQGAVSLPSVNPADYDRVIDGRTFTDTLNLDFGDDNVLIMNSTFSGINGHAAQLRNVENVTFYNNTFEDIDDFGIMLRSTGSTNNVSIIGNSFTNIEKDGIHAAKRVTQGVDHPNLLIYGNSFNNAGYGSENLNIHTIYVQSSGAQIINNTILGNIDTNAISIRGDGLVAGNYINAQNRNQYGSGIKYYSDHAAGASDTLTIVDNIIRGDDFNAGITLEYTNSNRPGSIPFEDWVVNDFVVSNNEILAARRDYNIDGDITSRPWTSVDLNASGSTRDIWDLSNITSEASAYIGAITSSASDAVSNAFGMLDLPEIDLDLGIDLDALFPGLNLGSCSLRGTRDPLNGPLNIQESDCSSDWEGERGRLPAAMQNEELLYEIKRASLELGMDPNQLAGVIWLESGGRPDAHNGCPRFSATGLIQFTRTTAQEVGIHNASTCDEHRRIVSGLDIPTQIDYTIRYYQQRRWEAGMSDYQAYATVHHGNPYGGSNDDRTGRSTDDIFNDDVLPKIEAFRCGGFDWNTLTWVDGA